MSTMIELNVVEGVHRVEDAHTNWYLIEEAGGVTVVDTGLPRSWASLREALTRLRLTPGDVEAVVLTHGHFDHMGFARQAQQELGKPVWAHRDEVPVVSHPWRYEHERSRVPYLRHPTFLRVFSEMTLMGALWVKGADSVRTYVEGDRLDVPGRPEVIATPGHTVGHSSLLLADRGAVIVGDAFVMLDPYTGRSGPCIVAGAATADSRRALSSLDRLSPLPVDAALTGHGNPWRGSLREAVERARAAGSA